MDSPTGLVTGLVNGVLSLLGVINEVTSLFSIFYPKLTCCFGLLPQQNQI